MGGAEKGPTSDSKGTTLIRQGSKGTSIPIETTCRNEKGCQLRRTILLFWIRILLTLGSSLMQHRRSCYPCRAVRGALSTLPASRFAQGQTVPAARRRSWRRRPIGLPLWRIAKTRLFLTWHTLCNPTRPDLRL